MTQPLLIEGTEAIRVTPRMSPIERHFYDACRELAVDPVDLWDAFDRCRRGKWTRERALVWHWMRAHDLPGYLRPPSYPMIAAYFRTGHSTIIEACQRVRIEKGLAWQNERASVSTRLPRRHRRPAPT